MTIRIANGQGFWGDWSEAPKMQLRNGPIDYLTMDYLAEITMSIMRKQKDKDPERGYARDFVGLMDDIMEECLEKDVTVITNAGGLNPESCQDALVELAEDKGLSPKIGMVGGDDIVDRLDEFEQEGVSFDNYDTGEPYDRIRGEVTTANVYLGSPGIVEALDDGADIIVTGRCTDSSIVIAPLIHEYGWSYDDHDLLAHSMIAGHLLECGGQATGGNYEGKWNQIEGLHKLGYPIAEVEEDGTITITKHEDLGGKVERGSVMQQLLYEVGDPSKYIAPEVVADITDAQLEEVGENRVQFTGINGKPATDTYKVSMAYTDGYKSDASLAYAWPNALEKAEKAEELIRTRFDEMDLEYEKLNFEYLGYDGIYGDATPNPPEDPSEVILRIAIRGDNERDISRFGREFAPLVFRGPACATAYGGGRPRANPILQYWPALIDKDLVSPTVSVKEAGQ